MVLVLSPDFQYARDPKISRAYLITGQFASLLSLDGLVVGNKDEFLAKVPVAVHYGVRSVL